MEKETKVYIDLEELTTMVERKLNMSLMFLGLEADKNRIAFLEVKKTKGENK